MCVPVRNETKFNYLKMYSQGVIHNIFSCQINFTQTTHTYILAHIILVCIRTRTSANNNFLSYDLCTIARLFCDSALRLLQTSYHCTIKSQIKQLAILAT